MRPGEPSPLGRYWLRIGEDLGIKVEAPYSLRLADGTRLTVDARVEQFGAGRGMLLVSDYTLIRDHAKTLVEEGFGFSTLSPPSAEEAYDPQDAVEVLRDWTWASELDPTPSWL